MRETARVAAGGTPAVPGSLPGAVGRARAGLLAVELREEPLQPVEVVREALRGVVLRVAEDANRPGVAAVADRLEQLHVEFAGPERHDLLAGLVAALHAPVEVHCEQVRLD